MYTNLEDKTKYYSDLLMSPSSNLLLSVLDAIPLGVIIADKSGEIIYINTSFTAITGVNSKQRVGRNILEIAPHCPLAQAITHGISTYGEKFQMYDAPMEILTNAKPIMVDGQLVGAVSIFHDITELQRLNRKLRGSEKTIEKLSDKLANIALAKYEFKDMIGNSFKFNEAISVANRAAKTDFMVLILGESGTGKELIAHSIHNASKRREKSFIKVNCAAVPENLLESEFFGYEKGAFTGANRTKLGMFELAHEGTIFLDEIGDMSLVLQSKLLRVLEEKEVYRIGGEKSIKVDVRVIAATNRDLKEMVKMGRFRKDLFYRLDVINVLLPPLKDREDDVVLIANKFLKDISYKIGISRKEFTEAAYEKLKKYHWPGNIRELKNVIEKAIVISNDEFITEECLSFISQPEKEVIITNDVYSLELMERKMIKLALEKFGDTVDGKTKAAEALSISLRTLYNKIKRYIL